MKNKKAFTLIELVSVLVILAILALIVTPLVLNIIKKARTAADKRSIDAYGRSVELAVADYLLDTGSFPTTIEQLTIEYSGDTVVCSNSGINSDGTIYLTDCTVNNRAVTGYAYGRYGAAAEYEEYTVGQEVRYNNVDYYVIKNSDTTESSVTLLKATPLTTEEVNTYGGVGTANNNVNMYVTSNINAEYYQAAYDNNGYGGMAYYSSATCGYSSGSNSSITTGCTNEYEVSEIKYVVDAWKVAKAPLASEARLIIVEELSSFGYEWKQTCPTCDEGWVKPEIIPTWIYNSDYWTMSQYNDSTYRVWYVYDDGSLKSSDVYDIYGYDRAVRPVIVINKSVLN